MCERGFHASQHPLDATLYAPGFLLHYVELGGTVIVEDDKFCASKRKILASIDATPIVKTFAQELAVEFADYLPERDLRELIRSWAIDDSNARRISRKFREMAGAAETFEKEDLYSLFSRAVQCFHRGRKPTYCYIAYYNAIEFTKRNPLTTEPWESVEFRYRDRFLDLVLNEFAKHYEIVTFKSTRFSFKRRAENS